jgi:CheY-like chemotaxis protein
MPSANPSILYVDDDEVMCFTLIKVLKRENYEAIAVGSVQEALELAHRESFDLYILDNFFLEGNGTSLCYGIREFDPHTPIIIYSGASRDSDRDQAFRAGANAVVPKPDFEELLETARRLLTDS